MTTPNKHAAGALYNEIEPFAVQWLRNLSDAGHIAAGTVEPKSIKELTPADVAGFTQAHFFAGIGVWSYALRLAGWPDGVPVWTGSCPCQPFSPAGRGGGFDDPRHLWPDWFKLIEKCRPPVILGEQVEGRDGRAWLDLVSSDVEGIGYAFGAAVLPVASVGAPHGRHRIFFVAIADERRREGADLSIRGEKPGEGPAIERGSSARVAHAESLGGGQGRADGGGRDPRGNAEPRPGPGGGGVSGPMADDAEPGRSARRRVAAAGDGRDAARLEPGRLRDAGGLGNADSEPAGRVGGATSGAEAASSREGRGDRALGDGPRVSGAVGGFWARAEWIHCIDGKARPVEPGTFPLAHGAPSRVGRLRAYGNAISPQVAATFIRAVMEASR